MLFKGSLSLKTRLFLSYVLILFIIVTVLGFSFFEGVKAVLLKQAENDILKQLKPLAKIQKNDISTLTNYLSQKGFMFAIIDNKFKIVAKSKKNLLKPKNYKRCISKNKKTVCIIDIAKKSFLVISMPIKIKKHTYVILIVSSLRNINNLLARYEPYLFLVCFITFLMGLAVWLLVIYAQFTRLEYMASKLDEIANGKLSAMDSFQKTNDEIGHMAKNINTIAQNYAKLIKRQGRFSALVAHELKTPISILKGSLEVILRSAHKSPEDVLKLSDNMLKEADRLANLCDRLLDIAKLENAPNLERGRFDLKKLINTCISDIQPVAKNRKIVSKGGLAVEIFADKSLIMRVIFNLLDNAVKYTNENGMIEIDWKLEKNGVLVSVKDNGKGIKQEELTRIFEPFYKAASSKKGAGLGLAFCKSVIEAHGGHIYVESKPGLGSVFTFFLPFE